MDVEIHPNAKKHLTETQVLGAWLAVTECVRREWLIIHALSPVQKKFWQEIERARQRGR